MANKPSRGGPLRQRLREATQTLHDRVEATDLMGRLTKDNVTRQAYAGTLRALARIYRPLEAALAQIEGLRSVVPDLDRRFKSESLARDLADLEGGDAATTPRSTPWPSDVPTALGTLYVLEGSTMGARVIASRLRSKDFVRPENLNFFEHYGRESFAFWQRLLDILEARPEGEHGAVIDGALRTFELFLNAAAAVDAAPAAVSR